MGAGSLAGCIGDSTNEAKSNTNSTKRSQSTTQTTTGTTTALFTPSKKQSNGISAKLTVVSADEKRKNSVIDSKFNCGRSTAVIHGRFIPKSGCYKVAIQAIKQSKDGKEIKITLVNKKSKERDREEDCSQTVYNYRLVMSTNNSLPRSITIEYNIENNSNEEFKLENNKCD